MSQPDKREGVSSAEIEVRECTQIEELDACVRLQREAFGLPDLELSPRRHLIVSQRAGGWTLGAFVGDELVGFVHHLIAVRNHDEIIGYSHMMAVARAFQNRGVGARLKWAQRERALAEGRSFIKWTWDPMQARNAHFNINRLGVVVRSYAVNFYGTDYNMAAQDVEESPSIDSDRLHGEWNLRAPRVVELSKGCRPQEISADPVEAVEIPSDWQEIVKQDRAAAQREQLRVRAEFEKAFAARLICAGFDRAVAHPRYLFYRE